MHRTPKQARTFALAVGCTALFAACSDGNAPVTPHGREQSVRQAIANGDPSGDDENAVVLVLGNGTNCTGALVAPNLVLTARHCLTRWIAGPSHSFECAPGQRVPVVADLDPTLINIYMGTTKPLGDAVTSGKAKGIRSSGDTDLCQSDVALLILQTPITNVTPLKLRLDAGATKVGEAIESVGWGTLDAESTPTSNRRHRQGSIVAVGPTKYQPPGPYQVQDVPDGVVLTTSGICFGDSGSPLLSATSRAVIGTAFFFAPYDVNGPATCDPAVGGFSTLATQRSWIEAAFSEVGSAPWLEGRERPRDVGGTCADDLDCNSRLCKTAGGSRLCTMRCETSACPQGFECVGAQNNRMCMPPVVAAKPGDSVTNGCSVGASTRGDAARSLFGVGALVAALAAVWRRRQKQRRA